MTGRDCGVQDRGEQGVQRADALEAAVLAPLLGPAVDPLVGGVDVDERHLTGARQQRGVCGQLGQEPAVDGVELEGMAVGEGAEEGAQRGRGTDPCEHGRHRTVTQHVKAVDAVRACGHAPHDAGDLGVRGRTRTVLRPGQSHLLGHQAGEPAPLGRPHHRDQPGMRDQIRVIERSGDRRRRMGNLHLGSALPIVRAGSLKNSHHRRSQGTSSFSRALSTRHRSVDRGLAKGFISSLLLCEIKTHITPLLASSPYRPPDVYQVSKDVVGAVAQVQKTAYKAQRLVAGELHRLYQDDGSPTDIEVSTARPRQVLVIGSLSEFNERGAANPERITSFEQYRRSLQDVEVITFDELYERACFIVGEN